MFDINDWANLRVYSEYLVPALLLILWMLWMLYQKVEEWVKLKRIHRIHKNVEERHGSTYWDKYRCNDCGRTLYEKPTSVNTSFNSDYISFDRDALDKCEVNSGN